VQDITYKNVRKHYLFSEIAQRIPHTKIILFDGDLPKGYLETQGSIGDKISTDPEQDLDAKITDRIMWLQTGEEQITTKPVAPAESHLYKEIQVHERRDTIRRKINIKNDTERPMHDLRVTFIETKEITFVESAPELTSSAPPEYKFSVEIEPGETAAIELQVQTYTKTTYKIEREKPVQIAHLPRAVRDVANPAERQDTDLENEEEK